MSLNFCPPRFCQNRKHLRTDAEADGPQARQAASDRRRPRRRTLAVGRWNTPKISTMLLPNCVPPNLCFSTATRSVRVRVAQLAANPPRRPLDENGANALRGYAAPEYACLGALVLAYGINPPTLARVPVSAISPEGRLENLAPSTPVAPLLLAQRLQRAWDGSQETDPLFSSGYGNLPIGTTRPPPALESSIHQRFRAIGRDTGLFTPARWIRHVEVSPVRRAAVYGITIHPLSSDTVG